MGRGGIAGVGKSSRNFKILSEAGILNGGSPGFGDGMVKWLIRYLVNWLFEFQQPGWPGGRPGRTHGLTSRPSLGGGFLMVLLALSSPPI